MDKLNIDNYKNNNLEMMMKHDYIEALKDDDFKKLVVSLKIKDDIAYKYTSKLERSVSELNNCKNCKNLMSCKNKCNGLVYYPKVNGNTIDFNYVACKYMKKDLKDKEEIKSKFFEMPYEIKRARIKDIDPSSKERLEIIKWITKFYKDYKKDSKQKGLYLSGSVGSGKTFIVSALLNELAKDGYSSIIVYYPELLRSLKEGFGNEDFNDRLNEIKKCDLLLLDDIGAEATSLWNRDEILGTILQYRMDNKLSTFFTSNLNLNELEEHFIIKNNDEEKIKARRIMERIKFLTNNKELIGENRRK